MTESLLFYSNSKLLEGPVFDSKNKHLYFVSILDGLVYFYDPKTKEILSVKLDSPVSCIFIQGRKKIIAASKNGFYEIDFNTIEKRFVFQIDIANSVRYNDGITDAKGRIIIGTMGFPKIVENIGKVFSYHNGNYKTIIDNTTISNGLAFSPDSKFLYFIDTPTKKVARYAYDLSTGEVAFEANVIEFTGIGSPDGMCMDKEGMLWIAEWGGGCVSQWNPLNGEKLKELTLPCSNVTSCCFDDDLNLYVTTAKSDAIKEGYGGGLYYIELNKI
ncbi:unnamed protein product [Ectocarpus sp. 12 AP-2014]